MDIFTHKWREKIIVMMAVVIMVMVSILAATAVNYLLELANQIK